MGLATVASLLGAFSWDPQVRGIVIVLMAVAVLPGSVFLIMGTNVGARIGFLIAVAGLSGFCVLLGLLWTFNAGGLVGRQPSWKAAELAIGPPAAALTEGTDGLPTRIGEPPSGGWRELPQGDPIRGDATAAADKMLAPDTSEAPEGEEKKPPEFAPPFGSPADYLQVAAYQKGGQEAGVWFRIRNHRFYKQGPWYDPVGWFRAPANRVVITVQKAAPKLNEEDLTEQPRPDLSQPPHTLVLVRDRGSLRFPPAMFSLFWLVVFAVTTWSLHQRDKEIMARRAGGTSRAAPARA
ncbi:MAG: hypothetical protein AVDCRST_MAG76-2140 [uncultured Acidimicrobiales bacterium]|uniref:Uncharacterized protein n=1 Tax=uncultured Acidimicrobiales bacterium TaxID=310071 RepID=A0A6J4IBZ7_9ACTN|nr:MAG: hypothetical protein AVDCRST_MAG76-2140 [uncultured Acidimicrobiales bacterium]